MKLKPCPMCGGEAKLRNRGFNTKSVECTKCKLSTAVRGADTAVKKWNKRDNADYAQSEMQRMEDIAEYQRKLDLALAALENCRAHCVLNEVCTPRFNEMINEVKEECEGWKP